MIRLAYVKFSSDPNNISIIEQALRKKRQQLAKNEVQNIKKLIEKKAEKPAFFLPNKNHLEELQIIFSEEKFETLPIIAEEIELLHFFITEGKNQNNKIISKYEEEIAYLINKKIHQDYLIDKKIKNFKDILKKDFIIVQKIPKTIITFLYPALEELSYYCGGSIPIFTENPETIELVNEFYNPPIIDKPYRKNINTANIISITLNLIINDNEDALPSIQDYIYISQLFIENPYILSALIFVNEIFPSKNKEKKSLKELKELFRKTSQNFIKELNERKKEYEANETEDIYSFLFEIQNDNIYTYAIDNEIFEAVINLSPELLIRAVYLKQKQIDFQTLITKLKQNLKHITGETFLNIIEKIFNYKKEYNQILKSIEEKVIDTGQTPTFEEVLLITEKNKEKIKRLIQINESTAKLTPQLLIEEKKLDNPYTQRQIKKQLIKTLEQIKN